LRAAALWGLLTALPRTDPKHLYGLLSAPTPAVAETAITIAVSNAGQLWLRCNPELLEQAARRTRMEKRRPGRVVINGTVQQVHTGDSYGDNTYNQYVDAGPDVLRALEALLDNSDFWTRAGLMRERPIIENAVSSGTAASPGVRTAIRRVLAIGGDLVLGIVGNGLYDALHAFVSR
jgi:hypothetical protein